MLGFGEVQPDRVDVDAVYDGREAVEIPRHGRLDRGRRLLELRRPRGVGQEPGKGRDREAGVRVGGADHDEARVLPPGTEVVPIAADGHALEGAALPVVIHDQVVDERLPADGALDRAEPGRDEVGDFRGVVGDDDVETHLNSRKLFQPTLHTHFPVSTGTSQSLAVA